MYNFQFTKKKKETFQKAYLIANKTPPQEGFSNQTISSSSQDKVQIYNSSNPFSLEAYVPTVKSTTHCKKSTFSPIVAHDIISLPTQQENIYSGRKASSSFKAHSPLTPTNSKVGDSAPQVQRMPTPPFVFSRNSSVEMQ